MPWWASKRWSSTATTARAIRLEADTRTTRPPWASTVADDTGATLELHVTDEGEGFPAPLLGRVFERFVCGERARGGGAGLGLAIARAVAEAHAGSAHAANRAPHGADVWLALPRPQRRVGSQE